MTREDLLYDMVKTHGNELGQIKEDIREIKIDLRGHIHRTEIAEENIEMLRKADEDCPGRKMAEWNVGFVNRAKDWAIIIGLLVALLKLFKVFPE